MCYNHYSTKIHIEPTDIRLMDVIGRGTYGVVHMAVWRGCVVAAKVIATPATATEQAMKEIEAFK